MLLPSARQASQQGGRDVALQTTNTAVVHCGGLHLPAGKCVHCEAEDVSKILSSGDRMQFSAP